MANLKEIRTRITSVSSTKQITSAMKAVSASKLHKAQGAIIKMRPYAQKLQEIVATVSALASDDQESNNTYTQERPIQNVLIVPITSNRGLCGGFNNNVIKKTNLLAQKLSADSNVKILPIGKKALMAFNKTDMWLNEEEFSKNEEKMWALINAKSVNALSTDVMQKFADNAFDKVILVYNKFKNAALQIVEEEQFLPILKPTENNDTNASSGDAIFEPDEEAILESLIPKALKIQFYKAMLDSHASEHAARMTAMHSATDNATELIKKLTLTYNKARQAAITNEILEIVSGAEALK